MTRLPRVPSSAAALLAAFFLVDIGACVQGDLRFLIGLPVTVLGFGVAWAAAVGLARGVEGPETAVAFSSVCLSVLAAIGVVSPLQEGAPLWYTVLFRAVPAVSIVMVGVFAGGDAVWRRRALWAIVSMEVALQIATPIGVRVVIDVWSWTETCTRALLHSVHPYTVHASDLQRGGFDYGSTPSVYPYPPFILLAGAPVIAVLGDYRFLLATCLPVTLALLRGAGRRLAVDPSLIDTMTIALALFPRAAALTASGYAEPLLVLILALFVFLAAGGISGDGAAIAFFLLPMVKQYAMALPLLYVAITRRWRPAIVGALVATATVAPFLVWNWRATMAGLLFFVRTPLGFRVDSTSLTALVAQVTGATSPQWLGPLAQCVAGVVAFWLLRAHGLTGLLLASALAVLSSFMLATQAFYNYYYFGAALLLFAALSAARRVEVPS